MRRRNCILEIWAGVKMSDSEFNLQERVREWLAGEGYPLEFRTARDFSRAGFTVRQGTYAKYSEGSPREIDVLAYVTAGQCCLRIYHIIECKWSEDKPWVVFTSEAQPMAQSACVNQTIGSQLGQSVAWVLAGEPDVSDLGLFCCPKRPGFSGRQAFSKGNDAFYAAIQSVIAKSKSTVDRYDERCDLSKNLPQWGAVAFPIVVVKGALFEAYMDRASGDICVEERRHLRVHWRGSEVWDLHASVDIISDVHATEFASVRARESLLLLEKMKIVRENIEECWKNDSLKELKYQRAPRGTQGLPNVLRAILIKNRAKELATHKLGPGPADVIDAKVPAETSGSRTTPRRE
jgi:hypothetical protein